MKEITGKTRILGIIGDPVEHSLSPVMHNAAIAHLNLDYIYVPFPVKPKDLTTALAGFEAVGVQGFNATIPHKQAIIPLLTEVSPLARSVGAVNTIWRTPEGWAGTNTDVEGFLAPLLSIPRQWHQIKAVVLGTGGAARAVVAGCAQLGCQEIIMVGRNQEKLAAFVASWAHQAPPVPMTPVTWEELPQILPQAGLLVNCTPVGMYPHIDAAPVSATSMQYLPPGAIVYDLIYTPCPTQFLQLAQDVGATTIDGLEMLVCQGAAGLKIWLGRDTVPVTVMRDALIQRLMR
ncbi:MAG TPA: shikimate dehydrogenase [Oscillatoriaceae cyanobacterium M33_DOE_052]|nr:shikimate dehydrogenase [Oscillatoriaceae cyanobacterium M33_DOE_052]